MIYEELPDELKILIDKEVNERFRFKMDNFLTSIKNIYPFYINSPDPYYAQTGHNLLEHYIILNDRFKKEMDMLAPHNMTLCKLDNLRNSFDVEFSKHYEDKMRGKLDRLFIERLRKLTIKYIDETFFS